VYRGCSVFALKYFLLPCKKEVNMPAFSNLFSSILMELVESPNSDSRPLKYDVALLLRKNLSRSFILVLDDIRVSSILSTKITQR
jgi:hypothetical protein